MSKNHKTSNTTAVVENTDDVFGPIIETPKTVTKKEDVRDYQKTPEVNQLLEKYGDKSKAIRALNKEGYKKGQIADMLRIRYQHVNNVLNQK